MHSQSETEQSNTDPVQYTGTSFPSVRYFQVHFEFLHEQFQQTLGMLESLQMRMQQLEQQMAKDKARQESFAVSLQSLDGQRDALSRSPRMSEKWVGRR
jgi:cell division protein FtsB